MINLVKRFFIEETGQGMAEYALILALIAVVVIAVLTGMGKAINNKFNAVNNAINQ